MALADRELDFLRSHNSAAMITVSRDGVPKTARVGVAFVDGALWSSGTSDRVRTRRLRRDPRCTLFVFDPGFAWMAVEATVEILDGPDAARHNLRLFREMQAKPDGPLSWFGQKLDEEQFLQVMVDEMRLIYEFRVQRTYGMY